MNKNKILVCKGCKKEFKKRRTSLNIYCSIHCFFRTVSHVKRYSRPTVKCAFCTKKLFKHRSSILKYTNFFCNQKCHYRWNSKNIQGKKHPSWKGGKTIDEYGYRHIRIKNKYIREHRYVMEQYLKRKLKSTEEVHHKNGNKLDNRIENLEVMSVQQHRRHHASKLKGKRYDLRINSVRVRELFDKGISTCQIAKILNCSQAGVWYRIQTFKDKNYTRKNY